MYFFGIPPLRPYQRRTSISALQKLTKLGEATGKPVYDIQACLTADAPPMQKYERFSSAGLYICKYLRASKTSNAGQTMPLKKPNTPSQNVVA
jgi:hypothetical protein